MALDLGKLFDLARWFHLRPVISREAVYFFMIFFGGVILAGLIVWVVKKFSSPDNYRRKILDKYALMLMSLGAIGLIWTGCRYERLVFFSARFWLLVLLALFVFWTARIWKYQFKVVPLAQKQAEQKNLFNKYLPKKK